MWSVLSERTCLSREESRDLDKVRWKSEKDRIGPPGSRRRCCEAEGSALVAREIAFDVSSVECDLYYRRLLGPLVRPEGHQKL